MRSSLIRLMRLFILGNVKIIISRNVHKRNLQINDVQMIPDKIDEIISIFETFEKRTTN